MATSLSRRELARIAVLGSLTALPGMATAEVTREDVESGLAGPVSGAARPVLEKGLKTIGERSAARRKHVVPGSIEPITRYLPVLVQK